MRSTTHYIQSIANGDFDIHSLPKLHSDESSSDSITLASPGTPSFHTLPDISNAIKMPPESWYSIDQELMSSQLVVGMVKHYQGIPTSTKPDKKPHISNERCNNYNDEKKGCIIEQKFNRPCVRRRACQNCDKLGHPAYKCPDTSNPSRASAQSKTHNPSN